MFAGLFGFVHGAGFAGYLQSLFMDHVAVPLLGFNIGIEVGQVVVLLAAAVLFTGVDRALAAARPLARMPDAFQLRLVGVSALVTLVAAGWAVERYPA